MLHPLFLFRLLAGPDWDSAPGPPKPTRPAVQRAAQILQAVTLRFGRGFGFVFGLWLALHLLLPLGSSTILPRVTAQQNHPVVPVSSGPPAPDRDASATGLPPNLTLP